MSLSLENLSALQGLPPGRHEAWCEVISTPLSQPLRVPVLVMKGQQEGPTLGLTAVVHGNELNGIPVIQGLFQQMEPKKVKGTVVGVPVVNIPSFERRKRRFVDGRDLNHFFPGNPNGHMSEIYAHRVFDKIIGYFDYLIDLHTASAGRINSYYVRADMSDPITRAMAIHQNAQIIVHNPPNDGTLRGAASNAGIPAITLEVGNPGRFQNDLIRNSLTGVFNTLGEFEIYPNAIVPANYPAILCKNSYWIYTEEGGVLSVLPDLADLVEKGQTIAIVRDIFGHIVKRYTAPQTGVVIGKSINPVNQSGGRIIHLGIPYYGEEE